ncbi:MAG: hypothetical protein AAGH99_04015 [Planctomycetota bacterium]
MSSGFKPDYVFHGWITGFSVLIGSAVHQEAPFGKFNCLNNYIPVRTYFKPAKKFFSAFLTPADVGITTTEIDTTAAPARKQHANTREEG